MELNSLREKLHSLIDTSTESRLLEVYDLLEQDYTDEFKLQLEEEYADYKKNNEVMSREELDSGIKVNLNEKVLDKMKLTLTIAKGEEFYLGTIKEIPSVITQGLTVEEARENVIDALALYLENMKETNTVNNTVLEEDLILS